jgi:hypothetical protein
VELVLELAVVVGEVDPEDPPEDEVDDDPGAEVVDPIEGALVFVEEIWVVEVVEDEEPNSSVPAMEAPILGPPETWFSAADTICQFNPVTNSVTKSQAEIRPNLRIFPLSSIVLQPGIREASRNP